MTARDTPTVLPSPRADRFEKAYLSKKLADENDMPYPDARRLVIDLMRATGDSLAERRRERAEEFLEEELGYEWDDLREEAAGVKKKKLDEIEERL